MMKNIMRVLSIPLILVLASAWACSKPKLAAPKDDLKYYMTRLAAIADSETEALRAYQNVMKDKNTNDADVGRVLQETVIPKMTEFRAGLTLIEPMTDDVIGLHQIYIRRTDTMLAAFRSFLRATRTQDKDAIQAAINGLNRGKLYYKQWEIKVDELGKDKS
jgi:hypothetical protein